MRIFVSDLFRYFGEVFGEGSILGEVEGDMFSKMYCSIWG